MEHERRLRIYLNDHLAVLRLARELASRSHRNNRGSAYGGSLEAFIRELDRQRAALLAAADRLGVRRAAYKDAAAWAAERAGRLKLNGRLLGYSPLSRLEELEGLLALSRGARSGWAALRELQDPRLAGVDLDGLAGAMHARERDLERFVSEVARAAVGGRSDARASTAGS